MYRVRLYESQVVVKALQSGYAGKAHRPFGGQCIGQPDDQPAGQQRYLVDIHRALADQSVGGVPLTQGEIQELQAALEHCHTIWGAEDDLGASPS